LHSRGRDCFLANARETLRDSYYPAHGVDRIQARMRNHRRSEHHRSIAPKRSLDIHRKFSSPLTPLLAIVSHARMRRIFSPMMFGAFRTNKYSLLSLPSLIARRTSSEYSRRCLSSSVEIPYVAPSISHLCLSREPLPLTVPWSCERYFAPEFPSRFLPLTAVRTLYYQPKSRG